MLCFLVYKFHKNIHLHLIKLHTPNMDAKKVLEYKLHAFRTLRELTLIQSTHMHTDIRTLRCATRC